VGANKRLGGGRKAGFSYLRSFLPPKKTGGAWGREQGANSLEHRAWSIEYKRYMVIGLKYEVKLGKI